MKANSERPESFNASKAGTTVKTDGAQQVNPPTQLAHENIKFILFVVTGSLV
jgi:hypothetical protein